MREGKKWQEIGRMKCTQETEKRKKRSEGRNTSVQYGRTKARGKDNGKIRWKKHGIVNR